MQQIEPLALVVDARMCGAETALHAAHVGRIGGRREARRAIVERHRAKVVDFDELQRLRARLKVETDAVVAQRDGDIALEGLLYNFYVK